MPLLDSLSSRLEELAFDARSATRALARDRSFSLTAIVTLTLAIGLNVAAFVVMNAMLFRGFPLVEHDDRLLYLQHRYPLGGGGLSYPDFETWRDEADSFDGIAFLDGVLATFSDAPDGRRSDLFARQVSVNAFALLGVQPALGRDFVSADEGPGAPRVAILSHRFWQSRFGGRQDIIGHTVGIDGEQATVIGVMPEGFAFPERENLWIPLVHTVERAQRTPTGWAVGRLAEGETEASARAELETIDRRLAVDYPTTNRDVTPRLDTFSAFFIGPDATGIYLSVWAAGCLVLLIACANLANLSLARALGRWHEFSTRIALGAGRRRLVQQILGEWLLLGCVGGTAGWGIANWSVQTWAVATESQYRVLDYTVDHVALAYAAAVSIAAALLIALVPITRVFHLSARGTFMGAVRGSTSGRRMKTLSGALVAGQMTLAIILLCGTGVLLRSFSNVVGADVGVEAPEDVLIGFVDLPNSDYQTPESQASFFDALQARLSTVPGVESASISNSRPVNNMFARRLEVEASAGGTLGPEALSILTAGAGYFRTIGATTLTGREFDSGDHMAAPLVAIVNDAFVERFSPADAPIGKRLRYYEGDEPGEWRTIVGVVSNIMQSDPTRQRFLPLVYLPFAQSPWPDAWFFARTRAPTNEVAAAVRAEVQSIDPDVVLEDFSTLEASFGFIEDRMDLEHVNMGKLAAVTPIFAAVAMILAAVGLYAVLARSVGRRKREIGIRMAIGASRRSVWRLVLREEMVSVALGFTAGLLASLAVNRVLQSQLVGVSPYDPLTLIATPILLALVAMLACQLPARHAMRVDPAVALRDD
jgi:putative ABC transport system permease protein